MSKPQRADNWWEDDEPAANMASSDDNWWEDDAEPRRGPVDPSFNQPSLVYSADELNRGGQEQLSPQYERAGVTRKGTGPAFRAPSAPLEMTRRAPGPPPVRQPEFTAPPAIDPVSRALEYQQAGGRAGELFREGGQELYSGFGGKEGQGANLQQTIGGIGKLGAGGIRSVYDFLAAPGQTAEKQASTMRTLGEVSGISPFGRDMQYSGVVPKLDPELAGRLGVDLPEGYTPGPDRAMWLTNALFSGARGQVGAGKVAGRAAALGATPIKDALLDATSSLTGGISDLGIMAGKPFVKAGRQAVDPLMSALAKSRTPKPQAAAQQSDLLPPQMFTEPPAPPSRGVPAIVAGNLDRALGAYLGAEVTSPGGLLPAVADPGDGGGPPDVVPGAAGAVLGALAPRAAFNAGRRVLNTGKNAERVASGVVRRILKSSGIRSADEARAASTARFGDKPAAIADLSQEGIGTAAGISRLPGETGDAARLRYEDLQRERTGRVFSDVETTTGIDPETVTKSLDDAIKAASEEISPAYEEMFAANAGVTSPRLEELAKDTIIAPYLRRATQAAQSLATTAGQAPSNARVWDLVKKALDRTITSHFNRSGGAPDELIKARDAVRGELDNLIPEYKGIRDNADAPRMRAARKEGKGVLTGRDNTVEKVQKYAAQLTGKPLTTYQSGVIEGIVPTIEDWRNQLGSLTSATTEKKLAAAFGEGPARELVARMKADLTIQQNAGRINPNIGTATPQAILGGGAGNVLADAVRLARSPVETALAALSRSGAYTRSQRDAIGQMLLDGATDANLARIFPTRRGPPKNALAPSNPTPRAPQVRGPGFDPRASIKDAPTRYRDAVMNAPKGVAQSEWDAIRSDILNYDKTLPTPKSLQVRIDQLENRPNPSAADLRRLNALKQMKAQLDRLGIAKAGIPAGTPEALGAAGGGVTGYAAAPDANNDGVVDAQERAMGGFGGALTGAAGAALLRGGMKAGSKLLPKGAKPPPPPTGQQGPKLSVVPSQPKPSATDNLSGLERLKRGLPMTPEDAQDFRAVLQGHEKMSPNELKTLLKLKNNTPDNIVREIADQTYREAKQEALTSFRAKAAENNREIGNDIVKMRERGVPDRIIARNLGLEDDALPHFLQFADPPQPKPSTPTPKLDKDGFDTGQVAYRGLSRPYDPSGGGRRYQVFTSSKADAQEYGANVLEAHLRKGRNVTLDAGGNNFNVVPLSKLPADVRAKLHPSIRDGSTATIDEISDAAQRAGYDSVSVKNVYDNSWGERPIKPRPSKPGEDDALLRELGIDPSSQPKMARAVEPPSKNYDPVTIDVVFDTKNIRSTSAKPSTPLTGGRAEEARRVYRGTNEGVDPFAESENGWLGPGRYWTGTHQRATEYGPNISETEITGPFVTEQQMAKRVRELGGPDTPGAFAKAKAEFERQGFRGIRGATQDEYSLWYDPRQSPRTGGEASGPKQTPRPPDKPKGPPKNRLK